MIYCQISHQRNWLSSSFHFSVCVCVWEHACVPTTAEGRSGGSFKALIYDQHYGEMYQMGNTVYNYDNYNWRALFHCTFSCLWTYSFYRVILQSVPLLKIIAQLSFFNVEKNVDFNISLTNSFCFYMGLLTCEMEQTHCYQIWQNGYSEHLNIVLKQLDD